MRNLYGQTNNNLSLLFSHYPTQEAFFKDIPPVNLHENLPSKFALEDSMRQLCPYPIPEGRAGAPSRSGDEAGEDPHPWLDACIMAYDTVLADQTVVAKYHMFHTTLALDVD